jgi:hypothetical protein
MKRQILYKYTRIKLNIVDSLLKEKFIQSVKQFRNTISLDYHPGSNNQIIDVIHPSLYPYIRNITQVKLIRIHYN